LWGESSFTSGRRSILYISYICKTDGREILKIFAGRRMFAPVVKLFNSNPVFQQ
jgi:hypothetical protein